MAYSSRKTDLADIRAAGKELSRFWKENKEPISSSQQLQSYTMDLCGNNPLLIGALKDAVSRNEFARMMKAETSEEAYAESKNLIARITPIYKDEILEGVSTFLEGFNIERGFQRTEEPAPVHPSALQGDKQTPRKQADKPIKQILAETDAKQSFSNQTRKADQNRPSKPITAGELIATSAISFIIFIAWLSLRQTTTTTESPTCIDQGSGSCIYQKSFSPFKKPKSTCVDQGDGSCLYR